MHLPRTQTISVYFLEDVVSITERSDTFEKNYVNIRYRSQGKDSERTVNLAQ